MNPSSPYKETLIAALGLTPQVITETLYYLTVVRRLKDGLRDLGVGAKTAAGDGYFVPEELSL